MRKYLIKKGTSNTLTLSSVVKVHTDLERKFIWHIKLDKNCTIKDTEDWNIVTGLDLDSMFSTRKHYIAVFWRCKGSKLQLAVGFQTSKSKNSLSIDPEHFIEIEPEELIEISIELSPSSWEIKVLRLDHPEKGGIIRAYWPPQPKKYKWAVEMEWEYNGRAPNDVTLHKEFINNEKVSN